MRWSRQSEQKHSVHNKHEEVTVHRETTTLYAQQRVTRHRWRPSGEWDRCAGTQDNDTGCRNLQNKTGNTENTHPPHQNCDTCWMFVCRGKHSETNFTLCFALWEETEFIIKIETQRLKELLLQLTDSCDFCPRFPSFHPPFHPCIFSFSVVSSPQTIPPLSVV